MSILSDLKSLFLPPVCPVCGGPLAEGDGAFCMVCRTTVPRTMFWLKAENPMAARLRDFFPVVQASAFIWFIQGSPWQRAIHDFKYRSRWRTAYELGRWFGSNLARSGLYAGVDCVVPVPLHVRRLLGRGYNQADYAAEGIAEGLGVPVVHRALRRLRNNPSQTTRSTAERWVNVEGLFTVRRSDLLAGKHILLVDDVVTTGSTLLACAEALAAALPECRISMAAPECTRPAAEFFGFILGETVQTALLKECHGLSPYRSSIQKVIDHPEIFHPGLASVASQVLNLPEHEDHMDHSNNSNVEEFITRLLTDRLFLPLLSSKPAEEELARLLPELVTQIRENCEHIHRKQYMQNLRDLLLH